MEYTYTQKDESATSGVKVTKVEPERWGWGVVYADGTELKQFGDDGVFHRIAEIQQDKIALWVLYRLDDPTKRIDIPWREGMKIIHKYRNVHASYFEDFNKTVKIYVFGYHMGGQNHYNYILPDDRIVNTPVEDIDLTKFNL